MKKLNDWKFRLSTFLTESASKPFEWGENDCALFMADAVKAQTGCDIAQDYRGKYKTEIGSKKALKKYGAGTLKQTVEATFKRRKGAPMIGDVVLIERPEGTICGIFTGAVVACVFKNGRYDISLSKEAKVYKVG